MFLDRSALSKRAMGALDLTGSGSLPWSALLLMLPVIAVTALARRHGFPARRTAQ